jgi:hypothetical protein
MHGHNKAQLRTGSHRPGPPGPMTLLKVVFFFQVYKVIVSTPTECWYVYRRYNEFYKLHDAIKKQVNIYSLNELFLMDCLSVACLFGQRVDFKSFTMSPDWFKSDQWKPRYHSFKPMGGDSIWILL